MTLRAIASVAAVVAAGSIFAGCPGAEILSYDSPGGPTLMVNVRVKGLAHVAQHCKVEARYRNLVGVAGVPMVAGGDEEIVQCRIENWKEHGGPAKDGVIDTVFFYRNARLHEYTGAAPELFDPEGTRVIPEQPEDPPSDTGRTTEPDVVNTDLTKDPTPPKATLPAPLSQDVANPTEVNFSKGRARLTCTVGASSSPQYAFLDPQAGKLELKIHVESQSDPESGEPAWWRVELVDKNGESLPDPLTTFAFVKPGGSHDVTKQWDVDGPITLKIESVNDAGDVITIELREGR